MASAQHWFHRIRIEILDSSILTTPCQLGSNVVFNPPLWQKKSKVQSLLRTRVLSSSYTDIITVCVNHKSMILILIDIIDINNFILYFSSSRGQYNKISSMIAILYWVAVSYHSYVVLLSMLELGNGLIASTATCRFTESKKEGKKETRSTTATLRYVTAWDPPHVLTNLLMIRQKANSELSLCLCWYATMWHCSNFM